MRILQILSCALAACLMLPTAYAGSLNDSFSITYIVPQTCNLDQAPGDIELSGAGSNSGSGETYFYITCPDGTPFTVETDNGPGGLVELHDPVSNVVVPGVMRVGDTSYEWATHIWGSSANGEEFHSVGHGGQQEFVVVVDWSTATAPSSGRYSDTVSFLMSF